MHNQKLWRKVRLALNDARRRCYDQTMPCYKSYGAVGITVQDSWLTGTEEFYKYVSTLPNFTSEMTLDRVDNTRGYCEGNIRWASGKQQVRNRGMYDNNSSGCTGVSFSVNQKGTTLVRARWQTLGDYQECSKSFSVKKYGLLPAFHLACEHRKKMIAELNAQGAGYSDKHGL